MKIFVELKDHEDKLHEEFQWDVPDQGQISDLNDKIKLVFSIDHDFQQLWHNGAIIRSDTVEEAGMKDRDTCVVKHCNLDLWSEYKYCFQNGKVRMENAKEAVKLHNQLLENGFFDVYSAFNMFRLENHYKMVNWMDGNIEEETLNHFRAIHFKRGADNESDFNCRFEARPRELGGSRKNTIAYVQLHGEKEETKYNVKCHHFGSSINSKGQSPNVKELFVYKLLELIKVGPLVQFILPNKPAGSRPSMYIATKWCDDFVPISKGNDVSAEVLVQILLLGTFLFIDDLHSDNCGQWKGTKKAAIVDFMPRSHYQFGDALLDNSSAGYWEDIHTEALEKCDEKSRLEMARKCLEKWDLPNQIDIANEKIKPEMEFKGFKNPTDELDHYIAVVKENLKKLTEMLSKY